MDRKKITGFRPYGEPNCALNNARLDQLRTLSNSAPSLDDMVGGIRRMLTVADKNRADEAERIYNAKSFLGMKVFVDPRMAPNEVAFVVGEKVMGRIVNIGRENGNDVKPDTKGD